MSVWQEIQKNIREAQEAMNKAQAALDILNDKKPVNPLEELLSKVTGKKPL